MTDTNIREKDKQQKKYLKDMLFKLCMDNAGDAEKCDRLREDNTSGIWKCYSLKSNLGKEVYSAFSDSELLMMLVSIAEKLHHSPAKKEVFWTLREYIKERFGKWPYALTMAGLSKSAGKGGPTFEHREKNLNKKG